VEEEEEVCRSRSRHRSTPTAHRHRVGATTESGEAQPDIRNGSERARDAILTARARGAGIIAQTGS